MRILGLDIGMASIGFALLNFDPKTPDGDGWIETMGVHLFDKAEVPKTGAPLALARRLARQSRRTIRRRSMRLQQLRALFAEHYMDFLPVQLAPAKTFNAQNEANKLYVKQLSAINPWQLRSEGLSRRLEKFELARVLYHIAKHRGFRSSKKGEAKETDSESSKMLGAANDIQRQFLEHSDQYPTIGAYFYSEKLKPCDKKWVGKVRNGNGTYTNSILRDLNEQEVRHVLSVQRDTFGQSWITDDFMESICKTSFQQNPLKSVEHMVGDCTLEKLHGNALPRAPRHSRSAELFVLWQNLNHVRIIPRRGEGRCLSEEEKQSVYKKAHSIKDLNYHQVRQCCEMLPDDTFNLVFYDAKGKKKSKKSLKNQESPTDPEITFDWGKDIQACEENKRFIGLHGYYALKLILGEDLEGQNCEAWDTIARILSFEQDITAIEKALKDSKDELNLNDTQIDVLKKIDDFRGTVNLSCKAIQALLPHLKEGLNYDEAIEKAGYRITNQSKGDWLPAFEKTNNPVVNRALAQSRKVINAVCREYGLPDKIHVELAREITRSYDDRQRVERENEKRRQENEADKRQAKEEFEGASPFVLKLWKEQQRRCLYSGKIIAPIELSDFNAVQIDHAIPYAMSYDNGYFNKVLVKTDENIRKGKRTVYQYFKECKTPEDWDRLLDAIKFLPQKKQAMITKDTFPEDEWKERHLNDTRWITRAVKTHLETYLNLGGEEGDKKRRVLAVNGTVTHYLRFEWGLEKDRKKDSKHHAQDAAVVAAATEAMIQKVALYNKVELRAKGKKRHTPAPWASFHRDVRERVDAVFVSRMPRRAVSGEIASPNPNRIGKHPVTGERIVIERLDLIKLNLKKLDNLIGKESQNRKLYDLLREQLLTHGEEADKAFKEPFYLDGDAGQHRIQKVSLYGSPQSGQLVRGGLVSNGSQVRVDVFKKEGKFYLCPVYAWHFKLGEIPNRVIVQGKKVENWPELNEDYQFHCSLYPNDFVRLTQKDGQVYEGYYVTTGIAVAQIGIKSHDDSPQYPEKNSLVKERSFGVLMLQSLEKYQVDYFGRLFLVQEKERPPIRKKVKRCDVANPSDTEPLPTQPPEPSISS